MRRFWGPELRPLRKLRAGVVTILILFLVDQPDWSVLVSICEEAKPRPDLKLFVKTTKNSSSDQTLEKDRKEQLASSAPETGGFETIERKTK